MYLNNSSIDARYMAEGTAIVIRHRRKSSGVKLAAILHGAGFKDVSFSRSLPLQGIQRRSPAITLTDPEQFIKIKALKKEEHGTVIIMVESIHDPRVVEMLLAGAYAIVDVSGGYMGLIEKLQQVLLHQEDDQQLVIRKLVLHSTSRAPAKGGLSCQLTRKEKLVLRLMAEGEQLKNIASETGTSYATVRTHLKHIYKKLGVSSASGAVIKAMRMEL